MQPFPRDFFARETQLVAESLLGTSLVRRLDSVAHSDDSPLMETEPEGDFRQLVGRIVETEAYFGPDDKASHARSGRTPRTTTMFGPLGHAYVYFTYGMHWMLNVVARRNHPAGAVLLRAAEPLEGLPLMRQHRGGRPDGELTDGPAKLCQAFAVTGELNGVDLCDLAGPLFLVPGPAVPKEMVAAGPRIGLGATPEPWKSYPLRYWVRGNQYVSR